MSAVQVFEVRPDEAELRLDRWFRRHYPGLGHGRLAKLLRTGQVRVDGKRAKAGARLAAGQRIRVPPIEPEAARPRRAGSPSPVRAGDVEMIRARLLYRDARLLAIDKPAGLPVQGGSRVARHLDAMLDGLRFDAADRPRLVHRLDRDTSGVLLLARDAASAAELGAAFRRHAIRKVYWALVVGVPKPRVGEIAAPLAKRGAAGRERVRSDTASGKRALTRYRVVETASRRVAWLALEPLTGRTHQLRAHCALLGTPILGDGKYGGRRAFLPEIDAAGRLHLHACLLVLPAELARRPAPLRLNAPLPPHMAASWERLGFDARAGLDPLGEGAGR